MEEEKLVQQSQQGDEEAFGALVKKYKRKVFHLAYSLVRNQETADDLAQEVFIKVFFALPGFKFQSRFSTWLYRIAVNQIKDHLRKEKKFLQVPFEESTAHSLHDTQIQGREDKRALEKQSELLHKAIQLLSPKYQIILSLRDIQGLSYEEISRILNISQGTVDSRLHRARKLLRKKIKPFLNNKGERP
ncbi:sigma-70 family RNA polymerase sigma factor [bacterium]|nr:sigma-70 family RNA polymerase sigma factor [bacterium]